MVKCPRCQEKFRVPSARGGSNPGEARVATVKPKPLMVKSGATKPTPSAENKPAPPAADKTSPLEGDFTSYGVEHDDHQEEEEDGEDEVAKHVSKTKRRERREQAFEAVTFPAKLISIPAIIVLIGVIIVYLFLMWQVLMYHYKLRNDEDPLITLLAPTWVVVLANTGWVAVAAVVCGLVVAGAEKMKKLENYPWALASCLFLPFGLLGLMVLIRPEVKVEFDNPLSGGKAKKKDDGKAKKDSNKKAKKK
jgi:hypothetical protein